MHACEHTQHTHDLTYTDTGTHAHTRTHDFNITLRSKYVCLMYGTPVMVRGGKADNSSVERPKENVHRRRENAIHDIVYTQSQLTDAGFPERNDDE